MPGQVQGTGLSLRWCCRGGQRQREQGPWRPSPASAGTATLLPHLGSKPCPRHTPPQDTCWTHSDILARAQGQQRSQQWERLCVTSSCTAVHTYHASGRTPGICRRVPACHRQAEAWRGWVAPQGQCPPDPKLVSEMMALPTTSLPLVKRSTTGWSPSQVTGGGERGLHGPVRGPRAGGAREGESRGAAVMSWGGGCSEPAGKPGTHASPDSTCQAAPCSSRPVATALASLSLLQFKDGGPTLHM